MENPVKMNDLGIPLFQETSIYFIESPQDPLVSHVESCLVLNSHIDQLLSYTPRQIKGCTFAQYIVHVYTCVYGDT